MYIPSAHEGLVSFVDFHVKTRQKFHVLKPALPSHCNGRGGKVNAVIYSPGNGLRIMLTSIALYNCMSQVNSFDKTNVRILGVK